MTPKPSRDLEELRSGSIGLEGYLRARLRVAMRPLLSYLSERQFRAVARLVECSLAIDPLLLRAMRLLREPDDDTPRGPRPNDPDGVE